LDGIGKYDAWNLVINDKVYRSFENKFSPGNYNVKLSHNCYEPLNFTAGINKGKREVFDMAGNITLKKGGLDLNAEKNGEPASEPVFVNGKRVGETPFRGAVPLCAGIEVGDGREPIDIKLKYKEKVWYTYKSKFSEQIDDDSDEFYAPMSEFEGSVKPNFWAALGLEVLGAVLIYAGYNEHQEMWKAYDEYSKVGADRWPSYYANVEDKRSYRNILYTLGGILLASGIGVHIWF